MCEIRLNSQWCPLTVRLSCHYIMLVATLSQAHTKWIKQTHTNTRNVPVRKLSLSHFLKLNCLHVSDSGLVLGPYALKLYWCTSLHKLVPVLISVEATAPLTKHYATFVVVLQHSCPSAYSLLKCFLFEGGTAGFLLLEASACVVSLSNRAVGGWDVTAYCFTYPNSSEVISDSFLSSSLL